MLVGVVAPGPRVLYRANETGYGTTSDEILARLEAEVRQAMAADHGVDAVGLGIPCTIDRERGLAISAVNLPIVNVPVRDLMHERIGLPVFLDNDANVAALAEHRHGAGMGTRNMIMLTLGTGIGGGLIIEGELYRGTTGAGAEMGHIVVDENGPPCQGNCPNHGCVETFASGTALAREGREAARDEPDSELGRMVTAGEVLDGRGVTEAALRGDAAARFVMERAGYHLGVALSSLANTFEPDLIVIGGGVIAAGDLLLDPAREELAARALPPMNRTPVVAAELGPDAGMIGAATMAHEELERP
jgi:glucokinase